MEGKTVETFINSLHVKIQNTPSYRADWKGIVEQYFRTVNLQIKPFLPGIINSDIKERGGKDYRLDAKIDIYQFTRIIIRCVLHHNNQHWLRNYNREETMISDEVPCIPREIWKWGIENRAGRLRTFPEDIVKLNLMPADKATVTARGIRFKQLLYSSETALRERWFETARNQGSWKVDISYDLRNINYIYLRANDGKSFEKCYLLEHQTKYMGKTLEEITYLFEQEKIELEKQVEAELQSKVDLMAEIEAIIKEVEENNISSSTQSKSGRLRGIKVNRQIEKAMNRVEEAFELDKCESNKSSIVIPIQKNPNNSVEYPDDIELFRKKQRERLNDRSE
ncbi:Mu transposase C-terminal domain-containing protein [Desulfofalx alkaliphila]|uniref:Mu transposase C-terminal domain-containing protein n=1 Tax=Desulfofalx alkaliphila TaxID=105483 RepID=UPI000ADBAEDF|nr:Mu transposase C-terminal domain-containing protein [Desulfofalx alkaliphila]